MSLSHKYEFTNFDKLALTNVQVRLLVLVMPQTPRAVLVRALYLQGSNAPHLSMPCPSTHCCAPQYLYAPCVPCCPLLCTSKPVCALQPGSHRLWVHLISVYLVTWVTLNLLWKNCRDCVLLRLMWIGSQRPTPVTHSVLVGALWIACGGGYGGIGGAGVAPFGL